MKSHLLSALMCLVLLVGSGFAATPTTELLYVQQGQNVVTYTVNTKTAVTKKLGTLATAYDGASPITVSRSGSFLYLLGFSPAIEYLAVYKLTTAGVPNPKPVQTLTVKPALHQFYIHPNGIVAYAMFSWTQVVSGKVEYASDVVLFTVNPKTGMLTNTTKVVANFPLYPYHFTAMNGMDSKGTTLRFKQQIVGGMLLYYRSTINLKTGALGRQRPFWRDDDYYQKQRSVFSDSLLVQLNALGAPNATITIAQNGLPLFECTQYTVPAYCGDSLQQIWMHTSGAYIFSYDYTLNETPIFYISLPNQELLASGASIPGQPDKLAFSPDGLLVYAVEGSEILTYVFNPHSGLLTARTTINAPGVGAILPWR
jgi:hypothetical protein